MVLASLPQPAPSLDQLIGQQHSSRGQGMIWTIWQNCIWISLTSIDHGEANQKLVVDA